MEWQKSAGMHTTYSCRRENTFSILKVVTHCLIYSKRPGLSVHCYHWLVSWNVLYDCCLLFLSLLQLNWSHVILKWCWRVHHHYSVQPLKGWMLGVAMVYQLCALGISTKKETLLQLSNWLSGISMSTDILSYHQLTMGISTQVCYNSIFFVKDLWGSFLCLFIYNNYDNIIFSLHPLTLCPEIFILLPNVKNKIQPS